MFNNHSIGRVRGGRLKAIFEKLKIYMLTTCKSYKITRLLSLKKMAVDKSSKS